MRQIAFAKGFKVSGTTLADILLRIAYFNNWYTDLASESIAMGRLKDVTWGEIKDFNLVIEDNHWNRTEMKHMLDTDALRIAMLRRPPIQFESMFNFFDLRGFYNVTSIEDFIDKLERNEITNNSRFVKLFGRNPLSWFLGLDESDFDNITAINNFIQRTEKMFDLVLISEFFDESLMILRDMTGFPISYFNYIPINLRDEKKKYYLSKKQEEILGNWNQADTLLYKKFKRLLEDRITPRIIQNVKTLQSINNRMHNFCQTSLNTTSEYHDLDKRFGTFDWNHIDSNRSHFYCKSLENKRPSHTQEKNSPLQNSFEVQRLFKRA
ncbi:hypothetical protein QYM36_015569, partial [Artemia franciscana]